MLRLAALALCFLVLSACSGGGAPPRAPAPVYHYGDVGGAGVTGIHTVRPGDTVWSISQRYRLSMRDVIARNDLAAPFVLHPGDRVALPPPREYTVRAGDTLYRVGQITGVEQSAIARLNGLPAPYRIAPGDVLRLPSITGDNAPVAPVQSASAGPEEPQISADSPPQARAPAPSSTQPPPRSGSGRFARPARGRIISAFGPKRGGLHNDGVNIAAPRGTPVVAAENGVVAYSGSELKGFGNLVLLRHEGGWVTAYAHLDSASIAEGQRVARGAQLGTVGSTGGVSEPQLHFEIRRGTKALDPAKHM